MNFFERRKILRQTDPDQLIPVRTVGHDAGGGHIILLQPKFESTLMHTLFPASRQKFFRIHLDLFGTEAWSAMDGLKSAGEIVKTLQEKFPGETDLEKRTGNFLSMLYERRYITFRQLMDS